MNREPSLGATAPQFHHTAAKERILAPDVARGLMLWSIAVANGVGAWAFYGSSAARPSAEGTAGSISVVANDMLVHVRGLPMFALLFGYGIGMLVVRETRRGVGWRDARRLLLRRYGWLAAIGAVHTVFLFVGDILLMYAMLGVIVVFLVPLRDRTLLWIAGVMALLSVVLAVTADVVPAIGGGADETMSGGYVPRQLFVGLISLVSTPVSVAEVTPQLGALILLGIVAARNGILEKAYAHTRMLGWTAAVGVSVALITGLAAGLSTLGVLSGGMWPALSGAAGVVAGPGIVAAIALICMVPQKTIRAAAQRGEHATPPEPFRSLQALGQRSMSGYVAQSVLFQIIAGAWFLDLFADAGLAEVGLWSTLVWLITLAGARLLAAAGRPGPLEALHRRLTYGAGENKSN